MKNKQIEENTLQSTKVFKTRKYIRKILGPIWFVFSYDVLKQSF